MKQQEEEETKGNVNSFKGEGWTYSQLHFRKITFEAGQQTDWRWSRVTRKSRQIAVSNRRDYEMMNEESDSVDRGRGASIRIQ